MTGWQERCPTGERRAGAVLARLINARGPVPIAELTNAVPGYPEDPYAAARSLAEDLELLTSFGLKIERCGPDDSAYRIAPECWQERPLQLDEIDRALLDGAIELAGAPEPDLAEAATALNDRRARERADTTVSLSPKGSESRGRPEAYSRMHRLSGLMDRRVTVGFGYPNSTGEIIPHRLQVAGMGEIRGVWYAVGWEPGSQMVRAFAVSEMRGPVRELDSGGAYGIHETFDLAEHLAMGWRLGPDPFWAKVRFDATLSTYASSVLEHIPLEQMADGCLEAEMPVGNMDGFIGWVLSFGTHARIVEPPLVVERAREILEQTVERHG